MNKSVYYIVFIATFCNIAIINNSYSASINDTYSIPPEILPTDIAHGRIDNKKYIAAISKKSPNNESEIKLVALESSDGKNYHVTSSSRYWSRHERHMYHVAIKNNSIYLYLNGSGGCCSEYHATYQFKYRDGILKLIGIETRDVSLDIAHETHKSKDDKTILIEEARSINLSTGKIIYRNMSGEGTSNPEKSPYAMINKKLISESQSFFKKDKIQLLSEFDIWAVMDMVEKIDVESKRK